MGSWFSLSFFNQLFFPLMNRSPLFFFLRFGLPAIKSCFTETTIA